MIEHSAVRAHVHSTAVWLSWAIPIAGLVASASLTTDLPVSMNTFSPYFSARYAILSIAPGALGLALGLTALLPPRNVTRGILINAFIGITISLVSVGLALIGQPMPMDICDPF